MSVRTLTLLVPPGGELEVTTPPFAAPAMLTKIEFFGFHPEAIVTSFASGPPGRELEQIMGRGGVPWPLLAGAGIRLIVAEGDVVKLRAETSARRLEMSVVLTYVDFAGV